MRRLVAVAAVVAALGASWPTVAQVTEQAAIQTDGLDGDPEIEISYYDVPGRDQRAIRAAIDRLGPTDSTDGERVHALTKWSYQWRWRRKNSPQGCSIDGVEIGLRITVLLPRPVEGDRLNARVRKPWDAYMIALRRHELGHVAIARAGREEIRRALEAASCDGAADAAKAASARVGTESARYDRETRHGRTEGASF
ncbi:DUF922 domain-containing protein [Caulobacter hibisci]|uniref:DUF922 domain-containing protein n=1 Tax=Caulobacter hibisci TaxID=2035993 RepID=A0ABS0SY11_9CAUL|nr:DUF922 domain-containing protein [Caulobacter hibisci]MBI1684522.1 DUF922 domain-containing protein [Caulobacter hibisci]